MKSPPGASGSIQVKANASVSSGKSDHFRSGFMSLPSQVNSDGIKPPSSKSLLSMQFYMPCMSPYVAF